MLGLGLDKKQKGRMCEGQLFLAHTCQAINKKLIIYNSILVTATPNLYNVSPTAHIRAKVILRAPMPTS